MKSPRTILTIIIIIAFVLIGARQTLTRTKVESTSIHPDKVVLYATDWCGYCEKTRDFFKQNNIDFLEFDIEKSAQGKAEYQQLNGRGVPLVIAKGKLIRGYNPNLMLSLFASR